SGRAKPVGAASDSTDDHAYEERTGVASVASGRSPARETRDQTSCHAADERTPERTEMPPHAASLPSNRDLSDLRPFVGFDHPFKIGHLPVAHEHAGGSQP